MQEGAFLTLISMRAYIVSDEPYFSRPKQTIV